MKRGELLRLEFSPRGKSSSVILKNWIHKANWFNSYPRDSTLLHLIQFLPSGFNSFQAIGSNLLNPLDPNSHFFSSNSFNPSPLTLSSNLNQNIFSFPFHLFSPFPEHILFFLLRSITPIGNLLQIFNSHDLFLSVIFCQDNKFICAFSLSFHFLSWILATMRSFYSFTTNPLEPLWLTSNWKIIFTTAALLCGMVFRENLSSPSYYPGLASFPSLYEFTCVYQVMTSGSHCSDAVMISV